MAITLIDSSTRPASPSSPAFSSALLISSCGVGGGWWWRVVVVVVAEAVAAVAAVAAVETVAIGEHARTLTSMAPSRSISSSVIADWMAVSSVSCSWRIRSVWRLTLTSHWLTSRSRKTISSYS